MHHLIRLTAAAALALAAPGARAEVKLGYVDFQRAIKEVEEGKAAGAALQRDFQEKQKQLNQKSDEVKRLQEEFQKQSLLMTPEAKAAKGAEIERKMMETQEFYVKLQQDLSGREREAMRPLADKMTAIVREIAEAEAFTMVMDREASGIIYAPASLDLTNELIRKFNAKYPGSGAKKADAPAKKADAPAPAPAPAKK
jgi:outer membrane protein